MSDPTEDVAEAVKVYLGDSARAFLLPCIFSVPVNPATELFAEHDGIRCLVIPIGESEEKQSRNSVFVQPQVNLIFTSKVGTVAERVDLSGLVRAVTVALRFVKMAGWGWRATETITKFDSDLMKKGSYLSAKTITYQGIE